jgi:signal transduction histidine kinase
MRRSFRTTAIALAAASFLALLEVFRTTMARVIDGHPVDSFDLLHRLIPTWLTIVVASPWCAFMAWRFPLRGGGAARTLSAHLAGAAVFVALHLTLLLGLHALVRGAADLPTPPGLVHLYAFYIVMEMSVYAAIVGVLLLLEERRESAERAIATARLAQGVTAARLESLQAQIRPHFLFNTLNALAVLARRGDGAAVDHAIGDLGELLRASFDAPGRHEIPLAEDLEFLERYLSLQRIRFPDRLAVEWAVDDEARGARIPPLLVQPLVENAIEHGLESAHGGRVRVAARRDGQRLEIVVSDDGPGFAGAGGAHPAGVGLANTRERLALLYGADGTLTTGERQGGGGEARIRIPWRTAAAAEPAA